MQDTRCLFTDAMSSPYPTSEEDDAGGSHNIAKLLKEQYQHTEDYCNATTALHNALQQEQEQEQKERSSQRSTPMSGCNNLLRATQSYQDALHRVQNCLGSLQKLLEAMEAESNSTQDRSSPLLECLQLFKRIGGL